LPELLQKYPDLLSQSNAQNTDRDLQSQMRQVVQAIKQLLAWLEQRVGTAPGQGPQKERPL
jgi:hypothetical protein